MRNSSSFDHILKKAFETQDYPPIPPALLQQWQRNRSEKTTNWLWIAPGLVFLLGIVVGVWLAPMGLSCAFESLKLSFVAIMHYFPESTLPWALALVLAIIVLTMDNMRGWFRR